jgi:hypothetical protein
MRIVMMGRKTLSPLNIGSHLLSADRLALLQVAGLAGTSRLATWTLDSVRPALQRQTTQTTRLAARQSHALYLVQCREC